jgi:hypothetical protein
LKPMYFSILFSGLNFFNPSSKSLNSLAHPDMSQRRKRRYSVDWSGQWYPVRNRNERLAVPIAGTKISSHETDTATLTPRLSALVVWFHQLSLRSLQSPDQYAEIPVINGEPPATMPIMQLKPWYSPLQSRPCAPIIGEIEGVPHQV